MDKLNLLKQFVIVVEQRGFSSAASHLGLSPSTLSKGIAKLEQNLKIKLFHRSTRQVQLTNSGKHYLSIAKNIINQLEQCEQQLQQSNDEPKGPVKLNVPISYGRRYVVPLLQGFNQSYPDIHIELLFNDAYVDMLEHGFDLTIRSGTLQDQSVVARKLSPTDFLICAAPEYLAKHGAPKTSDEFCQHPWIRFRYRQTGKLMPIMEQNRHHDPGQQYIVDDGESLAELCAQGLGLTQIPHFIARDWIRNDKIIALFPYYRQEDSGVYLVYPDKDFLPSRVRVFMDYLVTEIEALDETPYHTWAERI